MKEKIWRGEYVDIFSLLHTEPEPTPHPPCRQPRENEGSAGKESGSTAADHPDHPGRQMDSAVSQQSPHAN